MKSFIRLSLVIALTVLVGAEKENEFLNTLKMHMEKCVEEEKAADSDVHALGEWKMPESRKGQCVVACVAEKFQIFESNMFSPEKIVEITEKVYEDAEEGREEAIEAMRQISEECRSVTHEDRCEMAVEIVDCFRAIVEREKQSQQ